MALAALTRFDDPYEGLIAASALSASGIPAVCHAGGLADVQFTLRQATHGFGVWVDRDDLSAARAFLAEHRTVNPDALAWTRHPQRWRGVPLALLAVLDSTFIGWLIVGAKVRPTPVRVGLVVGVLALVVALTISFLTPMFSAGLPF